MIYVIYGPDRPNLLTEAKSLIEAQRKKYPDLTVYNFSCPDYSSAELEEKLIGQMLFASKFAVVLDGFLAPLESVIEKTFSTLSESPNLYLFTSDKVDAKLLKQLAGLRATVKKLSPAKDEILEKKNNFNPFALADALGERDRKRAWTLFVEALSRGFAPEEMFWKLVWKVKTMLLVQVTPDPNTLNLKPFVISQSKRHGQNFTLAELKKLSSRLVHLWHDSRLGLIDFELNLERLILEI